jgi:hypothetical protein
LRHVSHQSHTSLSRKLGVEFDDFYGPPDLIIDFLSWTVTAGEKAKVFGTIVRLHTVDVMHGFFFPQLPSKHLFHNVTMLKHFSGQAAVTAWDHDTHVTPSGGPSYCYPIRIPLLVTRSTKGRAACRTAKAFLSVDGPAGLALNWHFFSALRASDVPAVSRQHPADATALARAVHWVFSPLLSVTAKFPGVPLEGTPACFASEVDGLNFLPVSSVLFLKGMVASIATKFSGIGDRTFGAEFVTTMRARLHHSHSNLLFMVQNLYLDDTMKASKTMQGVA